MARSEPRPGAPGGRWTQRRSSLRSQSACRSMGSPIAAPTRVPLSPPVAGTHGSPVQRARKLVRLTRGSTFDLRPRPRPPPLTLPSSRITCRCQRPLRQIRLNWPSQSEGSWVALGVQASTFVKGALTEAWSRPALRLRTGAVAPGRGRVRPCVCRQGPWLPEASLSGTSPGSRHRTPLRLTLPLFRREPPGRFSVIGPHERDLDGRRRFSRAYSQLVLPA